MKLHHLVGRNLLKNRRNYKRKSKYETGYSADNMVYKNFIKDIYEVEDEDMNPVGPSYDMPKYLYHATFTSAVPQIKKEGLRQFQTSNWVKGKDGARYNKDIAGIFAFDNPIDALNWGGKMEWEFRDINKDISIIRIQIPEDDFWKDDPAEDPFVATTGKSKYSGQDISAESIIDSVRLDDLGRPGELNMSRDDWLKQTAEKLREDMQTLTEADIEPKGLQYIDNWVNEQQRQAERDVPGINHDPFFKRLRKDIINDDGGDGHPPDGYRSKNSRISWGKSGSRHGYERSVLSLYKSPGQPAPKGAPDWVKNAEGSVHTVNEYNLDMLQGDIANLFFKNYGGGDFYRMVKQLRSRKKKIDPVAKRIIVPIIKSYQEGKYDLPDLMKAVKAFSTMKGSSRWKFDDQERERLEKEAPIIMKFPDGMMWVRLDSQEEFEREGDMLQNCLHGYCPPGGDPDYNPDMTWDEEMAQQQEFGGDFSTEGNLVYSLRDKHGESHAAIEYDTAKPTEISLKGKQNDDPADKYMPYVDALTKHWKENPDTFGPKVTEGDMKADRKAGIKYVDDPDWKRLHDMGDDIIQAYIDHKEPKEELTERMDIESDSYGGFNARYNKKPNERGTHDAKIHPPQHLKNEIAVKSLEASSLEELRRISHEWVDKARESFKPVRNWNDVTGSPTLDLNREFIRDELGVSAEHWIKITELDNGDIALLVAPDDAIADYGLDTVQGENYKRMTIKKTQQGELTNTAASGMSKVKAQRLKLTPNGRYTLHRVDRKSDSMGSDIFLMKYDSIVDDPNIPQQLHQPAVTIAASRQLMNSAVLSEGINDPHIFKAVFMAGCPGSGKSYIAKALFGGSGLKVVNSDQVLEYLMDKHGLDPTMPDSEREERDIQRGHAKELTSKRRDNYVDGRLGLIIDGTGKDDGKIQNAKKELEDIGYETRMVFVDTDLKTAQERNMERPERSIDPQKLSEIFTTCRRVGGKLRRIFNFSKEDFHVLNNSKNSESEDKIKETYGSMQRWLQAPVTNRDALEWMDEQTGFSEGLATITEDACGDCFSKAGRAMINMTEIQELYGMQMVHAYVYGQGKLEGRRFPHAWTEQGDMVLDNSNGNNIEMHKAVYYKLGGVDEKPGAYATYNKEDTMKKLLSTQKYGPWDLDDTLDEGKQPEHNSSIAMALDERLDSHRETTDKRLSYEKEYPEVSWGTMPRNLQKSVINGIEAQKRKNEITRGDPYLTRDELTKVITDAALKLMKDQRQYQLDQNQRQYQLDQIPLDTGFILDVKEGDGRKKGIHPKGHPKRQAQQAAIHANENIFSALEKKSIIQENPIKTWL